MIRRLLVANRGEIARRIFRTCRDLGIETVAVFSDPDADAPHVSEADLAVRLSGTTSAQTYLDISRIVEAARKAGADAVHPGYGFLSENAGFARAVQDAGLTWIGPSPEAIAAMGSKIEAKRLMSEAGVPVLPSWTIHTGLMSPSAPPALADAGCEWAYPLMVKASAGGGGRGMRVVREAGELPAALASARREAEAAFGDGTVFAEPLLERARHIEVQILADRHGTVWALGERECSIQRRHQKVIEECPSPAVGPPLRATLEAAAVDAARTIGYVGAGTVEFLVQDDTIAFLEMNTRLQVEHPVTELVYGVDLVRLQLEVAEGARLPARPPEPHGHAIEVRLYAEDRDFVPQAGRLHLFEVPGTVRTDSGVESGSVVSTHYDPMLAKVVAGGASRTEAVRRLTAALRGARIHGLITNRDFLLDVLKNPAFEAGETHTGFLQEHAAGSDQGPDGLSALAGALAAAALNRSRAGVLKGLPSGWRNVRSQPGTARFAEAEVVYQPLPEGVTLVGAEPYQVVLERDGLRHTFAVAHYPDAIHVDSPLGSVRLTPLPRLPEPADAVTPGSLLAPMPGSVLRVEIESGDPVTKGQVVLVIEAMKMEHQIAAPADGVATRVNVAPGHQVEAGAVLAVIEESAA